MRPSLTKQLTRHSGRVAIVTAAALLGLAASIGCNGDNTAPSTRPPGLPSNLSVTLGDKHVTLAPGQSASIPIRLERDSYQGSIALAVTVYGYNGASGLAATIDRASLSPGETSATVKLSVAPTAPAGGFNVWVDATVAGLGRRSALVGLAIDGGPPGVSIDCGTEEKMMGWWWFPQGGSSSWPCSVTRTGGFHGAVELSVEGKLPPGVSVTFDPNPLVATIETTTDGSVIFNAADDAAVGTAYVSIRARADGVPDATFRGPVTVRSR